MWLAEPPPRAIASQTTATSRTQFARDLTLPALDAHATSERVQVFGRLLTTDRPLPGLPVATVTGGGLLSFWALTTVTADDGPVGHSPGAVVLGSFEYSTGISVTLAEYGGAREILISDTGRFVLDSDSHQIWHHAPPDVDRGAVALDLIGVVLPYLLHQSGAWCVHASAVQTPQGVIAFVAPRGTGKSTLAAACARAGCALVADDVVVMRGTAGGVTVTPAGLPIRLRESTARAVGVDTGVADDWGKVRITGAVAASDLPLAAMYVLHPLADNAAPERVRRGERAAALALLTNGKITELLGHAGAGDALTRCVSLASVSTSYDLGVPRDLSRLPAVVNAILSWHAGHPPSGSTTE
jgi:hypothetical protein